MREVHHVNVQIGTNRIVEGFYTIEDGVLTMTYADGDPVKLDGLTFQKAIQQGDKPHQVAGFLTKQIRQLTIGEVVDGFNDPIVMPVAGYA